MVVFEFCCGDQLAAPSVGGRPLDRRKARAHRNAYLGNDLRDLSWPANLRRVARGDPEILVLLTAVGDEAAALGTVRTRDGQRRSSGRGCPARR
jgi:hypothetical protein